MERHRSQHAPGATNGAPRFGALLRLHRLAAGLTQAELARRAGLSLRGVNALESGERHAPRTRTIALLAGALGISPSERVVFEAAGRQRRPARQGTLVLLPPPTRASTGAIPAIGSPGVASNLPEQPDPLLGREAALVALVALALRKETRLITVTGVGGAGKTRLALAAARALFDAGDPDDSDASPAFPDGVWLVRLAPLTDPALVIPTIAQTLGLSERNGVSIQDLLRAFLREKTLLLLLDNFEHVAAAAPQVAELLEWSAGLKLLITSRAALRLRDERRFPISLLPVPPRAPSHPVTAARLEDYAATALFLQRARAAQPNFTASEETAPDVAGICARLDGLPLAIELAATWTRLLSPAALRERLERQAASLGGGPVDAPERQRTLRATIAWSYDLLAEEERLLFRRLAVFADACGLAEVEAVCQAPVGVAPLKLGVLEGLGRLLDQSLIVQRVEHGEPLVGMLHVIREFALDALEDSDEAAALRSAHARYFVVFAERMELELRGPRLPEGMKRVERDLGEVRAALGWARSSGAPGSIELGLRLATALWRFWFESGRLSEGQQWVEALVGLADSTGLDLPLALRARVAATCGALAAVRRDIVPAMTYLEQAITLGRESGDWLAQVIGLELSGAALRLGGDLERAERRFEEALRVGREAGDALATYTPLASLAEIARSRGDLAQAAVRFHEALAVSRQAGHRDHMSLMFRRLGELALLEGENQRAVTLLRHSYVISYTSGKHWHLATVIELLAVAQARLGREEHAARLFGAAVRLRETTDEPYALAEQPLIDTLVEPVRAALSAGRWVEAYAAGRALTLEETFAESQRDVDAQPESDAGVSGHDQRARIGAPRTDARPPEPRGAERLTRRELDVLRLLTEGHSDAQIASRLVISVRTVNHHVAAIFAKLGVSSRAAATRAALDGRLL